MATISGYGRPSAHDSVALGFIHPGDVYTEFFHSALRLTGSDSRVMGAISETGRRGADSNRNDVVRAFLWWDRADWLLFLDADMGFDTDLLTKLFEVADADERPVVSALHFSVLGGNIHPNYSTSFSLSGQAVVDPMAEIPDSPFEVESIGGGGFLTHRSVFERMLKESSIKEQAWFENTFIDGTFMSYDQVFARRVRAMGLPILVHPDAQLTHYNRGGLTKEQWLSWKEGK